MAYDDGLARRFQEVIHLDDYTPPQLAQICEVHGARKGYSLAPELLARPPPAPVPRAPRPHLPLLRGRGLTRGTAAQAAGGELEALIAWRLRPLIPTQNAGLAVKLVENAVVAQCVRTADEAAADTRLLRCDFEDSLGVMCDLVRRHVVTVRACQNQR